MHVSRPFCRFLLLLGVLAATDGLVTARLAAQVPGGTPPAAAPASPGWDFFQFVDELPDTIADLLPDNRPKGSLRVYIRPRYGDLIRRDYLRVPVGTRWQITENIESTAEVEGYFTHGLGGSAGDGFSGLLLGLKCEHVLSVRDDGGFSLGVNFTSPLSRPPQELTDGHRHLLPFIAATRPLLAQWQLLGYASLGADLLQHTAMPAHFGRNELHANSLVLSAGAAREWPRFRAALTASVASTAVVSDERRQVFALRPEVVVPLRPAGAHTRVLLTLGGRAVWGPDGHDLGVTSSVRIETQVAGGNR